MMNRVPMGQLPAACTNNSEGMDLGALVAAYIITDRPHLHDAADSRQKTDVLTIWREARAIGCAYIEITLETIGFCHAFYLLCFRSDCITSPPPITSEARTMLIDRRVAARF